MEGQMLSVQDVAKELNVSYTFAYRLLRRNMGRGVIRLRTDKGARQVLRVPRCVFDSWLAKWAR